MVFEAPRPSNVPAPTLRGPTVRGSTLRGPTPSGPHLFWVRGPHPSGPHLFWDHLADGKTHCDRRFGEPFEGPIIPFGSLVEYHPISARDQSRLHQFGKKVLPGIFLGKALIAGRIWRGDILVADIEELEKMDVSEIPSSKNQCKRSIDATKGGICFYIPNSRWYSKIVKKRPRIPRSNSKAGTACRE